MSTSQFHQQNKRPLSQPPVPLSSSTLPIAITPSPAYKDNYRSGFFPSAEIANGPGTNSDISTHLVLEQEGNRLLSPHPPSALSASYNSLPTSSLNSNIINYPCHHPQSSYLNIPRSGNTSSEYISEPNNTLVPSIKSNPSIMSASHGSRIYDEYSGQSSSGPSLHYSDPNPNKIEIKTKFPVARIKRIMQADEEVGKVAQVTPVAVSKALELFMIALVSGAADKAREKGSKKVSAQHLKMVVEGQPERFDFLAEIVERVGDSVEGASHDGTKSTRKRKEESESASEEEKEKEKSKLKKVRGRKKKGDEQPPI
ncbi:unnamed protein product [Blumeria hordei]|uniref:NCT transcriptional regulatory complex subunit A n=2 Tax=Blumeria hordei TaxID=2867405 RepID=A0A383UM29_BLUHO|nr:unnamed protein product [Blumeria hordei]